MFHSVLGKKQIFKVEDGRWGGVWGLCSSRPLYDLTDGVVVSNAEPGYPSLTATLGPVDNPSPCLD